jgi:hypothetical protein
MTDTMVRSTGSLESASWFLASARERLAGLLDPGSFVEFLPPRSVCRARIWRCLTFPRHSMTE